MFEQIIERPAINLWGKSIHTTNADGQSIRDQGALWGNLMQTGFLSPVPSSNGLIYGVYHDYEGDYSHPFNFAIAAEIENDIEFEGTKSGLTEFHIPAGRYAKFTSRKGLPTEVVGEIWQEIWNWSATSNYKRAYKFDFELYKTAEMATGIIQVQAFISIL